MCSICGYIGSKTIQINDFYQGHYSLRHRGPDDEGFVTFDNCQLELYKGPQTTRKLQKVLPDIRTKESTNLILSHNRLSILDMSSAAHQPMIDATDNYVITFNGEVYNYIELRNELESKGIKFKSNSDTEVVLQSYINWGTNCFTRFNGMWALAILDKRKRKVIFSRDRVGIKPLYYSLQNENLLFASEVKFFYPLISLTPDNSRMFQYLDKCLTDHDENTFFKEVKQLKAGFYGEFDIDSKQFNTYNYWNLESIEINRDITFQDAVSELHNIFSSSLDLRMRSDVQVGSLLSGGIDSSAIVSNLAHYSKLGDHKFNTFSAVYHEKEFSEKSYIDLTIQKYPKLNPNFIYTDPEQLKESMSKLLWTLDFPFRSLSIFAQNTLYKYIDKTKTSIVLLNGQGADEIFGGYKHHYYYLILNNLLSGQCRKANLEIKWLHRYRQLNKSFILKTASKLYLTHKIPVISRAKNQFNHLYSKYYCENSPKFSRNLFLNNLCTGLSYSALPEYLRYEDRNSMAYSKETRLPYLDYRLVEFALSLPDEFKIHYGQNKRILRAAVNKYTPAPIIKRKDKTGFITPQEVWQKKELKHLIDKSVTSLDLPFINRKELLNKYELYKNGNSADWAFWWRVYCLNEWLNLFQSRKL